MTDLNAQLLAAHSTGDTYALVALYTQAADQAPDTDAACFFLTHAYIFALETAHPDAGPLHARLKSQGRV
ncbi:hypothetical protein [Pseudooctadecabacter sp.]|uniref:hypothetical protein n=1 Tax=Pseudooctadecabacter sp. TaxID=1966338 RepID=UPI0025D900D2|nr:hypothetical protein [Pseudooctadecabacter sp.]